MAFITRSNMVTRGECRAVDLFSELSNEHRAVRKSLEQAVEAQDLLIHNLGDNGAVAKGIDNLRTELQRAITLGSWIIKTLMFVFLTIFLGQSLLIIYVGKMEIEYENLRIVPGSNPSNR